MKKIVMMSAVALLTLCLSGFALAASHAEGMNHGTTDHGTMNHGTMDQGAMGHGAGMSMEDGMKGMEHNLMLMKQDVAAMQDEAGRAAAMKAMKKHMNDMHTAMMPVKKHAEDSGNSHMQQSMKQIDMDMMTTMKGMGMMKKDPAKAMPMMNEGIDKMLQTMTKMKGMM